MHILGAKLRLRCSPYHLYASASVLAYHPKLHYSVEVFNLMLVVDVYQLYCCYMKNFDTRVWVSGALFTGAALCGVVAFDQHGDKITSEATAEAFNSVGATEWGDYFETAAEEQSESGTTAAILGGVLALAGSAAVASVIYKWENELEVAPPVRGLIN